MYEHKRRLYKIDKVIIVCEGIKANWFALVFADSSRAFRGLGLCTTLIYTVHTIGIFLC